MKEVLDINVNPRTLEDKASILGFICSNVKASLHIDIDIDVCKHRLNPL